MARNNTVDITEERNTYLLELFRHNPELKSAEAQERVKAKFGSAVSSRVLNQLREQAQTEAEEAEAEVEEQSAPEPTVDDAVQLLQSSAMAAGETNGTAAPTQKPRAAKGKGLKHVFVEAPKEQLDLLERVAAQLQEAGVANMKIDHVTERWMVFAVESK